MKCNFLRAVDRLSYFAVNFIIYFSPSFIFRIIYRLRYKNNVKVEEDIMRRVDYYCHFNPIDLPNNGSIRIKDYKFPFKKKKKLSTYFLDLYNVLVYFNPQNKFIYEFGDVTHELGNPGFVKSRPVMNNGLSNSVILKLNKKRHYRFVEDLKCFSDKKDMLVSRNNVSQPHRILLMEKYFEHPMCDLGQINRDVINGHTEWIKDFMTIEQQLQYKFISCIEGNDVATNLKWVMSSNSLPVMPKPKYETWFMEGTLIPDYHYVCVRPDYSDLIEKMNYYISNPDKAEEIINHNHEYIRQFQDNKKEKLISLLVIDKYFSCTNQK